MKKNIVFINKKLNKVAFDYVATKEVLIRLNKIRGIFKFNFHFMIQILIAESISNFSIF